MRPREPGPMLDRESELEVIGTATFFAVYKELESG
jgi:hypothetical protein